MAVSSGTAAERGDDPFIDECPGREIFNHLSNRWGLLIMIALLQGQMRFFELRDRIGGISEKMLSQNLKTLNRDGLLARHVEPTTPPMVSYSLTDMGREIALPLQAIVEWLQRRVDDVLAAQQEFDGRR